MTLELPVNPALTSGEVFDLLSIFSPKSRLIIYVSEVKLSEKSRQKLNLNGADRIFPIDFLTNLRLNQVGNLIKEKVLDYKKKILDVCKELNLSCKVLNDQIKLTEIQCDLVYPVSSSDRLFRALTSYSNNFVAELTTSLFSDDLEIEDGIRNLKNRVKDYFTNSRIEEFTGLSRQNRLACFDLARYIEDKLEKFPDALHFLRTSQVFPVFRHIFSGSLSFNPSSLFAKTGTLSGVSSIAGFYIEPDGKRTTFCIIQNCDNQLVDLKSEEVRILNANLSAK
ncbi:MAG: D-alanyl-D-alanine carboxypeptidase [Deltaproteobacteria bacterium]|nr:D-alanyl-D-alanine carboxypeptidase [Deltaproteobacteria bacterium]